MSTLDEITKEKQRIGQALAQVDAQREKLTGQLGCGSASDRDPTADSVQTIDKRE